MTRTSADIVAAYNAGRDPARLALKYKAMRDNPFSFLRGTAHLFHQRLIELTLPPAGPAAWITGDLHLENFGTYLGSNGLTYFDVNDFDESALAPCSWDILRLATSILVAAPSYKIDNVAAVALAQLAIETYRAELGSGKPRWLERKTADGVIGDLMDELKHRDPQKFVLKRTINKRGEKLDTHSPKMIAIANKGEYEQVRTFVEGRTQAPGGPSLYKVKDAAFRIAGTGSLGIRRYVVLAEHADTGGLLLLDIKESLPSSASPASKLPQPTFTSEAQRVVAVQTQAQAMPPFLLQPVALGTTPFVLKELQPTSDRLNLVEIAERPKDLSATIVSMASLAAWAQLRSSGHMTAVAADELAAFAQDRTALKRAVPAAQELERTTLSDWQDYCRAFDGGAFAAVLKAADPSKGE